MSEQKKNEKQKERKLLPTETKYLKSMSDLLAEESGMDKEWISCA